MTKIEIAKGMQNNDYTCNHMKGFYCVDCPFFKSNGCFIGDDMKLRNNLELIKQYIDKYIADYEENINWKPKENEAVMIWLKVAEYFTVVAYTEAWENHGYTIAKYDGRLDLRVSEIGDDVPRLKYES